VKENTNVDIPSYRHCGAGRYLYGSGSGSSFQKFRLQRQPFFPFILEKIQQMIWFYKIFIIDQGINNTDKQKGSFEFIGTKLLF
jgi:hypothetical protein